MIDSRELLEWEEIFGHRSGTPAEPVRQALEAGTDVVLELDVMGARHVREVIPEDACVRGAPRRTSGSRRGCPRRTGSSGIARRSTS
jgi:guanylate kinase